MRPRRRIQVGARLDLRVKFVKRALVEQEAPESPEPQFVPAWEVDLGEWFEIGTEQIEAFEDAQASAETLPRQVQRVADAVTSEATHRLGEVLNGRDDAIGEEQLDAVARFLGDEDPP